MNTKVYAILYIGWYVDNGGKYIVKIGTTNDIKRRTYEHNRYYHNKAKNIIACCKDLRDKFGGEVPREIDRKSVV